MKKINWKLFNLALWTEIILSYILPFGMVDRTTYKVGFPIPHLTAYDKAIGVNPLLSMHLNPMTFLLDVVIMYLFLWLMLKVYYMLRK